jgi:hypothetical protein
MEVLNFSINFTASLSENNANNFVNFTSQAPLRSSSLAFTDRLQE